MVGPSRPLADREAIALARLVVAQAKQAVARTDEALAMVQGASPAKDAPSRRDTDPQTAPGTRQPRPVSRHK